MCVQWNELSKAMEVILTALIQTFFNSKCQKLLLIYYSKVGDKKTLRGAVKKNKNSIFKDIIQIEVDLHPSHPIFDKFIFDKVLIMLTSLPPLEFLTKITKF